MRSQVENKIKQSQQESQPSQIANKKPKAKYCSLIAQMLKKNNNKIKNPIVLSFVDFMTLDEKLKVRTVCKQWNEAVKKNLPFLGQENFINTVLKKNTYRKSFSYLDNSGVGVSTNVNHQANNSGVLSINSTNVYTNNTSNTKVNTNSSSNPPLSNTNFFDHSDQKFSKKKTLVKLINTKNYNLIKKVGIGEMTKSRVLLNEDSENEEN